MIVRDDGSTEMCSKALDYYFRGTELEFLNFYLYDAIIARVRISSVKIIGKTKKGRSRNTTFAFKKGHPLIETFTQRISFLGSSLNAVVVFNLEVKEKREFSLENGKIIAKNSRNSGKNGVIFGYFCCQSTKSDICAWEITRRHEWKPTERIG